MDASVAEGMEQHREERVDDDDREETGHDRRRRRTSDALRATARRQAALAGDERDAEPEEHGLEASREDVPEADGLLRLDEVRPRRDVEPEQRDQETAGDADQVAEDREQREHEDERHDTREHEEAERVEPE